MISALTVAAMGRQELIERTAMFLVAVGVTFFVLLAWSLARVSSQRDHVLRRRHHTR